MKRREFSAALTALALAGCSNDDPTPVTTKYRAYRGDRWVEIWITSAGSSGTFFVSTFYNPMGPAENKSYPAGTPLETMLPPDTTGLTVIGNDAAVDISVDTVFGLAQGGRLLQLDLSNGATVRTLVLAHQLSSGVASPGNEFLYLLASAPLSSFTFAPSIRIVNLTTFQETGSIPLPATSGATAAAITPDGKYLYVAGALTAQVFTDPSGVACHIIDTATRAIVKTLNFVSTTSINRPKILIAPDGGRAYLTTGDGVACIDTLTQTHSHTIPEAAEHLAISPDGTILYLAPVRGPLVTNPNPPPELTRLQGLALYNTATSALIKHIPVDRLATMTMALSQDGATMLLSRIPLDPVTQRNGFPERVMIDLARGVIAVYPWTGPLSPPVTIGTVLSVPMP